MITFARMFLCCTGLFLLVACDSPSTQASASQCGVDRQVEARIAEAWRLHEQGHLEADRFAAASIYTDDVWFRWDDGRETRSRVAMEDFYTELYTVGPIVDIAYMSDEILVCGDAAHEVGHYYVVTEIDGQRVTLREHHMSLWRRQPDESWKLSRGAGSTLPEES